MAAYPFNSAWKAAAAFGFITCILYILLVRREGGREEKQIIISIRQSYWCWLDLRSGADTVDNAYSGEDNILMSIILDISWINPKYIY